MLAYEFESCADCDGSDTKRVIALHDLTSDDEPLLLSDFVTVAEAPENAYCGEKWGAVMLGPSFSPDGGKLCAVNGARPGVVDGLATIQVNTDTSWHWINTFSFWFRKVMEGSSPECSPTRDEIAFYIHDQPDPATDQIEVVDDIYLISADGSTYTRLTNDGFMNTMPSWSPDGQWIAFVSDRDGGGFFRSLGHGPQRYG